MNPSPRSFPLPPLAMAAASCRRSSHWPEQQVAGGAPPPSSASNKPCREKPDVLEMLPHRHPAGAHGRAPSLSIVPSHVCPLRPHLNGPGAHRQRCFWCPFVSAATQFELGHRSHSDEYPCTLARPLNRQVRARRPSTCSN